MKDIIGFKVVSNIEGVLSSCSKNLGELQYYQMPEYICGERTFPLEGCGPLAVFEQLEDALHFCSNKNAGFARILEQNNPEIWRCKYVKSKKPFMFLWKKFYPNATNQWDERLPLPPRTVLAKWIMLEEMLYSAGDLRVLRALRTMTKLEDFWEGGGVS